ncbi:MAG: rRNA cytosine-C5-methyltransferase [Bacteroidota bacterium]|nr:rRNA cytosine-C5-methyltransferase [Bacteroidota bacterium]
MKLPSEFRERTRQILTSQYEEFEESLKQDSPVSIRLNPLKTDIKLPYPPVPWSSYGYYLNDRPSFTFDPLFHAGVYYVQEASSMFTGKVIRELVTEPVRVLDLCAAPGGKSTDIISSLPENSLLVSNEIIRNRAWILAENITKWGYPNCIVTNNSPEEIGKLTHFFDVIAVDAPCSGEGMFRKDPGAIDEWSVSNVNLCASRQQEILENIWEALRPGGFLIYSTCTYNLEENERNVQYCIDHLDAQPVSVSMDKEWKIQQAFEGANPVYRFMPHRTTGEGFFLSVLQKTEGERYSVKEKSKDKKKTKDEVKFPEAVKSWIHNNAGYNFYADGNFLKAHSQQYDNEFKLLKSRLIVLHSGITLAEIKGKDMIPQQSLALSYALNRDNFTCVEIELNTAIFYLRKEAIELPEDCPKGFVLLTFKNTPLGWVKNLGNRANNLYPQEWRIRSGYIPEEIKTFW